MAERAEGRLKQLGLSHIGRKEKIQSICSTVGDPNPGVVYLSI